MPRVPAGDMNLSPGRRYLYATISPSAFKYGAFTSPPVYETRNVPRRNPALKLETESSRSRIQDSKSPGCSNSAHVNISARAASMSNDPTVDSGSGADQASSKNRTYNVRAIANWSENDSRVVS